MKSNHNSLLGAGLIVACFLVATSFRFTGSAEPVVRASKIELVDSHGVVRASLKVEDDGQDGSTAMFRIFDSTGTIRVKLGGSNNGSGLVLLNDGPEVGFQATAGAGGTKVTVANKDGKKNQLLPE